MSSFSLPDADRIRRALEAERDRDQRLEAGALKPDAEPTFPETTPPPDDLDGATDPAAGSALERTRQASETDTAGETEDAADRAPHKTAPPAPPGATGEAPKAMSGPVPAQDPPNSTPPPAVPPPPVPPAMPPQGTDPVLDPDAPFSHHPIDDAAVTTPPSRWRPLLVLLAIVALVIAAIAGWTVARSDDEPVSAGASVPGSATPTTEAASVTAAPSTAAASPTTTAVAPSTQATTSTATASTEAATVETVDTLPAITERTTTSSAAPEPATFDASIITELVEPVELRASPSTAAPVVGELGANDPVRVLARQKGWYRIGHRGADAWVFAGYVRPPAAGFEAYISIDGSQLRPTREDGTAMGGYLGGKYAFGRPVADDDTVTIFLPNGALGTLPASQVRPVR